MQEHHISRETYQIASVPADKLGARQAYDVLCTLLNDQVINSHEVSSGKPYLIKQQIDSIQTECHLIFQQGQVSTLDAGTIANDETTLPFVFISDGGKPLYAGPISWIHLFTPSPLKGAKFTVPPEPPVT